MNETKQDTLSVHGNHEPIPSLRHHTIELLACPFSMALFVLDEQVGNRQTGIFSLLFTNRYIGNLHIQAFLCAVNSSSSSMTVLFLYNAQSNFPFFLSFLPLLSTVHTSQASHLTPKDPLQLMPYSSLSCFKPFETAFLLLFSRSTSKSGRKPFIAT